MPKNLPIGVDNFAKLVDPANNYLFVDKSLFIKEAIDDKAELTIILRPRRWAKTLNFSMLHHFLAPNVYGVETKNLFNGLAISTMANGEYINQHQGQYPVIFVSFKDIKEKDFVSAENKIKLLMQELYNEHSYLASSDKLTDIQKQQFNQYAKGNVDTQQVENAIKVLSYLLKSHFDKKVYILIDEYDTPLNYAHDNQYLKDMTDFLKNIFSAALKGNHALQKGFMTGILRISKDSMLSSLNNPNVFTLLSKHYKQHFGFTNEELDFLFTAQDLVKNEDKVKEWYNGYIIDGLTLYNPWSIIKCLYEEGELKPYWVNTADDSLLKKTLQDASPEIKEKFQLLLEGKSIEGLVSERFRFEDLAKDEISIWALLLYTGYLTALSSQVDNLDSLCKLTIPNKEVLALYKSIFINWLHQPSKAIQLRFLLESLVQGNLKKFAQEIAYFLQSAASIHDYATQPEAFYHGFMLALTASLLDTNYIDSNKESGLGRPDLLFIPKDQNHRRAIILEFKHVHKDEDPKKVAEQGLAQIKIQAYASKISQYNYITSILAIGLAFDGKKVVYASEETPTSELTVSTVAEESSSSESAGKRERSYDTDDESLLKKKSKIASKEKEAGSTFFNQSRSSRSTSRTKEQGNTNHPKKR